MPDPLEARVSHLEYGMYDVHARLARSEENYAYLSSKYHLLVEGLSKSHQVSFGHTLGKWELLELTNL